ncbi:F-box/WD repeat-containing protein 7-like isoform X3 [Phyllopteryx taeniolatus]|uniref:F-box/WD repeat-containing protein 7-like isoform X3 n=1 Tax=Phyllopteryx taeniolatus TaxID=161469 RepID=UPI002AD2A7E2|nr:F-box/WD repeat-containing protein 7-like isoform X3 [Phyllopteryx taeniolatus]
MGFYGTLKLVFYKVKRKLAHGPEGRPFSSGKKRCRGDAYFSPSGVVQTAPTTFGDLRLANGRSAQRRRVTSGPPPRGLRDWLVTFQAWSGPERLLALDQLIDRCQTGQVRHVMQVIEPHFQRDFISLLPKELALYVLNFLAPRDLLQAAQTCRYWRILAEDNLLWREKCREEGVSECSSPRRRTCVRSGVAPTAWKSTYIRQQRIENNWRNGDARQAKVQVLKGHDDHVITCLQFSGDLIVSGSDDNTLKVWSAITGKCVRTLTGHTGGVWCSQMAVATVISGSTDRTLRVWNADSGECVHTLHGHTSTVRCVHLHGNRRLRPHADGPPVADQRDGAAGPHPRVRERRLHRPGLGHPDGPLSAHPARSQQAPVGGDVPAVLPRSGSVRLGRRHGQTVGPPDGRLAARRGGAAELRIRWRGVANQGLGHQAGLRRRQQDRHRGDQTAGAGLRPGRAGTDRVGQR